MAKLKYNCDKLWIVKNFFFYFISVGNKCTVEAQTLSIPTRDLKLQVNNAGSFQLVVQWVYLISWNIKRNFIIYYVILYTVQSIFLTNMNSY